MRFVRHAGRGFRAVAWKELLTVWNAITAPEMPKPPTAPAPRLLPAAPSLRRAMMLQHDVLAALGEAAMQWRRRPAPADRVPDFTAAMHPGDALMVPGSPWLPRYAERLERLQRHGMRTAMLSYDMLPLRHPEWCNPVLREEFKTGPTACCP